MEDRIEDEERDALEALSNAVPNRKSQSYSQQLRAPGNQKRHHQIRNHSFDEDRIPKTVDIYYADYSDDDFYPYESPSSCDFEKLRTQSLPEFIGSGGESSIFKAPVRAAVHPGRPPCLELRPHPLKETQVGKFLRNIACTETQLWAGQECGIRVWRLEDAFECGLKGKVRRGDEDAAPFHESVTTSPVMCLVVDAANRLVWSGHKDGKIRSWKMDQQFDDNNPFKEGLSWQAHRGPVLAMIMTSCGDIWSGSEGGVIRIWAWETIEKSLSLSPEEKHMAALLVERSFIDLKSQVTVNGVSSISSQDVKCLLADTVKAKVWCATPHSFSFWDARTKELLKVFNIEGLVENRVDTSSVQEQVIEDEMKVKFVSTSKKEKPQSFLQRSRNAIMGAADAVRRVATKGAGAFAEESKRTEALVLSNDGMIWSGCTNGLLVQWDGNANRLRDFTYHPYAVQCFCSVGTRIYVGYVSGTVQVLDLEGNLLANWVAHSSPVIKMVVGTTYIFSLATHGGIRGWNITSPGTIDNILRSELATKETVYTRRNTLKILSGTWNVGQGRPSPESLKSWLGSKASDVGIVVIGLQEVDMGAGFLAMSAAKDAVGMEGALTSAGQWWVDVIGKTLEEGTTFERMGSRQLAGLLISLWVRKSIRTHVGDIDSGAVACGFGRAIGNKGAVALRMRVYDRIMCFLNCHFAAHLEAVNRRNADFDHVFRNMAFSPRSTSLLNNAAAGASSAVQVPRNANTPTVLPEEGKPELSEADMVVFLGDFNYRLHSISYDEARDFVSQRCFDWLREKDQLRAEMKAGKVFQGFREAIITFPPTYKFQRHQPGLGGYDSGEKKRIPAWCDRIIFRDTRPATTSFPECNLDCPVIASVLQYEACMDVTESDHKPVRCKFGIEIAHVDRSVRRNEYGEIIKSNEQVISMLEELHYVPETVVNTENIVLQNQDIATLQITNKCTIDTAVFQIICEGQCTVMNDESSQFRPRGSFGFPRWLEVTPAAGIIKPEQQVEVSVRHEDMHTLEELVDGIPQNWWSEDTRDKEVILVVNVQGSCSTETRSHRIRVRHNFSAKPTRLDSKSSSSKKSQGGPQRSDLCQLSNSSNAGDDI